MQKTVYFFIAIAILLGSCPLRGMQHYQTKSYTKVPLLLTLGAGGVGCYFGYKNSLNEIGSFSTAFGSFSLNYIPDTLTTLAQSRTIQLLMAIFIGIKAYGCICLSTSSSYNYAHEDYAASFLTLVSAAGIAMQTGCEIGILKQALDTFYSSRLSFLSANFSFN